MDCDVFSTECCCDGDDVGEMGIIGGRAETDIAEANAPHWLGDKEWAGVEVFEVVENPKDGAETYVYGVIEYLGWVELSKLPDVALEGWSGRAFRWDGALVDEPL